jgi:regulatory protein
MTLTELKQTGHERFLARFDTGEEVRVTLSNVAELGLYAGLQLDDAGMDALRDRAARSKCRERAMRVIGARPMSEKELYDRLVQKGETPQNAEETVAWLRDLHLLNDAEYAAMCVRHYAAKGFGPARIRNELYRRGVPRALWDEALEELPEQDDEIDRLLRRRLRGDVNDRDAVKKATDWLYRRGFKFEDIREAVERLRLEEGF